MKVFLIFLLTLFLSCNNANFQSNNADLANLSNNNVNENVIAQVNVGSSEVETDFDTCKDYEQTENSRDDSLFNKIDFKNFSYPRIREHEKFKLKNGCLMELEETQRCTYTLASVDFTDFDNNKSNEALIDIKVWCAAGSSSMVNNLYLYTVAKDKISLIWNLTNGSESHCGLKEYEVKNNEIIMEVFSDCLIEKSGDMKDIDPHFHSDFDADLYTRFIFGWNGKNFGVIKREVFSFTQKNIHDYLNEKYKNQIQTK